MQSLPKMPISPLSKTSRCLLLLFSLSSSFECDSVRHILKRFSKNFEKFATLYQKCRIEKIFEISPLTKSSIRVRLKMRTAKKEIFLFSLLLANRRPPPLTSRALLIGICSLFISCLPPRQNAAVWFCFNDGPAFSSGNCRFTAVTGGNQLFFCDFGAKKDPLALEGIF